MSAHDSRTMIATDGAETRRMHVLARGLYECARERPRRAARGTLAAYREDWSEAE